MQQTKDVKFLDINSLDSTSPLCPDREYLKLLCKVAVPNQQQREIVEKTFDNSVFFIISDPTPTFIQITQPFQIYYNVITEFIHEFKIDANIKDLYIEDKRDTSLLENEPIIKLICHVDRDKSEETMLEICQRQLEIVWKYNCENDVDVFIVTSLDELKARFPQCTII